MSWDYLAEPDTQLSNGFILSEEAALKGYVSGHSVPDAKGGKSDIPVWFRWPDSERRKTYPFITIDLLSVQPDYDRAMSYHDLGGSLSKFENWVDGSTRTGMYLPDVSPDVVPPGVKFSTENYRPYKLMFQIQHVSRNVQHDRYLMGRFITDLFPSRNFFVGVNADNTWRRCELLEWNSLDMMETSEAAKREFRKVYTISMEAEVLASTLKLLTSPPTPTTPPAIIPPGVEYVDSLVRKVHVDFYDNSIDQNELVNHLSTATHSVAVDNFTIPVTPSGP